MGRHRAGLALLFAVAACRFHPAPGVAGGDPNVITYDEIEATHEPFVYDVIKRLHSEFLRDRGAMSLYGPDRDVATVFINNQAYGPLSTLQTLASRDYEQIRYIAGHDAVIKFGKIYSGGVIQLISRVE